MSLLIAFTAGLLSFFAPCGTFLLPGFLAYAFDGRVRRVTATWTFLAGFSTLFVPVGLGAYALGAQLALHRRELALLGGLFMIGLGMAALFGKGLHVAPPDGIKPAGRDPRRLSTVYILGLTFGFTIAGCSAPLLAITLALAGVSSNLFFAAALLLTYVIGLGSPLLALSVMADQGVLSKRLAWTQKNWRVTIASYSHEFLAANVVAAVMIIGLGLVFIMTQGSFYSRMLISAPGLLDFNVAAAEFLSRLR